MKRDTPPPDAPHPGTGGRFATTHWSVVLEAGQSKAPHAAAALEQLCRDYWFPLYGFVRRQGFGAEDAEDLTQEFLADLLRRDSLRSVGPEKGRFRSFLLVALKRHLANARERAGAQKRGGGVAPIPFDTELAETRFRTESGLPLPSEALYERRWALEVMARVMEHLRGEAAARGKEREFDVLKGFLALETTAARHADAAAALGVDEGTVRVAVHRLRHRFRELFREVIAGTVADPAEVDDEIRHLVRSLGS